MGGWDEALALYELDRMSAGQSDKTIRIRLASAHVMIRGLAAMGVTDPGEVTRAHMLAYLAKERRRRAGAGPASHYADCKSF